MDDQTQTTSNLVSHIAEPPDSADRARLVLRLGTDTITPRLQRAGTMWSRMKGLLGRSGLAPDEGLWITPCTSIHMFFMRFPIDVVFLDRDLRIVRVFEDVQPWKMARGGRRAHSVLELPAGRTGFYNLQPGDELTIS
jgi:uncharacterized membrane protein (UPF0127 family)